MVDQVTTASHTGLSLLIDSLAPLLAVTDGDIADRIAAQRPRNPAPLRLHLSSYSELNSALLSAIRNNEWPLRRTLDGILMVNRPLNLEKALIKNLTARTVTPSEICELTRREQWRMLTDISRKDPGLFAETRRAGVESGKIIEFLALQANADARTYLSLFYRHDPTRRDLTSQLARRLIALSKDVTDELFLRWCAEKGRGFPDVIGRVLASDPWRLRNSVVADPDTALRLAVAEDVRAVMRHAFENHGARRTDAMNLSDENLVKVLQLLDQLGIVEFYGERLVAELGRRLSTGNNDSVADALTGVLIHSDIHSRELRRYAYVVVTDRQSRIRVDKVVNAQWWAEAAYLSAPSNIEVMNRWRLIVQRLAVGHATWPENASDVVTILWWLSALAPWIKCSPRVWQMLLDSLAAHLDNYNEATEPALAARGLGRWLSWTVGASFIVDASFSRAIIRVPQNRKRRRPLAAGLAVISSVMNDDVRRAPRVKALLENVIDEESASEPERRLARVIPERLAILGSAT